MNYICYAENKSQYDKLRIVTCDLPLEIRLLKGCSKESETTNAHTIFLISNGSKCLPISNRNASAIIIPYDNVTSTPKLRNSHLPLITYGMSNKATISCSSITEDCLLISLQRSIKAFSGNTLEPQELILNRQSDKFDNEIMMIKTAIKILICE